MRTINTTETGGKVKRVLFLLAMIGILSFNSSAAYAGTGYKNIAEYKDAVLTFMKNYLVNNNLSDQDKEKIKKAIEADKNNGFIYIDFAGREVTSEYYAVIGLGAVSDNVVDPLYVVDTAGICEKVAPLYEKLSEHYFGEEGKGPAQHGRITFNKNEIRSFGVWIGTKDPQYSGGISSNWKKLYTSDPAPEWAKPLTY